MLGRLSLVGAWSILECPLHLNEHARYPVTLAPRYLEEGQAGQQVSHIAPQWL